MSENTPEWRTISELFGRGDHLSHTLLAFYGREILKFSDKYEKLFQKTESKIEEQFLEALFLEIAKKRLTVGDGENQISIHAQYECGNHRVDFLVQSINRSLVVECDGHDFHHLTKEQTAGDKRRDRDLQTAGFFVWRFAGTELHHNAEFAAKQVLDFVMKPDLRIA